VEHRERFAPFVDVSRIVPVIIDSPVERHSDGIVHRRGSAQMKVENGPQGREFADLFEGSPAEIELTSDFLSAAWRKLCINSAGALSALTATPAGVFRDAAIGEVALQIVAECAAVGRAEGAVLDDEIAQQVLDGYRAHPPDAVNSMLADRLAGRTMEIDARNGVIVRKAAKHGIRTPLNQMTVALLQALAKAPISS
jgi:2-dehydropantoate 2-reductase